MPIKYGVSRPGREGRVLRTCSLSNDTLRFLLCLPDFESSNCRKLPVLDSCSYSGYFLDNTWTGCSDVTTTPQRNEVDTYPVFFSTTRVILQPFVDRSMRFGLEKRVI